jgi:dethiobiotin synthase
MSFPSLVVCSADTGDGKTWTATRLVAQLRAGGSRVAVCKPLESGTEPHGAADALALCRAAGWPESDLARVCPWQLPNPVAPAEELDRTGQIVDGDMLVRAIGTAAAGHDFVVVETAGGVRSPLCGDLTSIDLALLLQAPVVLVVANRLGAISRAVCAVRESQRAGARLVALVLNENTDATDATDASVATNHQWIARQLPDLPIVLARTGQDLPPELLERVTKALAPAR